MDFNDRVLQLAEDTSLPLLERLKFCAIYESNLDEFYMVRVAGVHDKIVASLAARRRRRDLAGRGPRRASASGRSRSERGSSACSATRCCRRSPSAGSGSSTTPSATAEELDEIGELFDSRVFPALTPLVFGVGRPFPYISNLSLSLLVVLRDPVQDTEVIARVKVPKELLRRFLPLGDGNTFVALEDVISHNLEALFPGMEVRRPRAVPGHPRHRLRRLRRGRRRPPGGRGGDPPPPFRRGDQARAVRRPRATAARAAGLTARDRRRSGLRRRLDRLGRSLRRRRRFRLRRAPLPAVLAGHPDPAAVAGGAVDRPVRGDPRGRHLRPPSL